MADRLLLEASSVDGFLLEDASGVLLKESTAGTFVATTPMRGGIFASPIFQAPIVQAAPHDR